ncbi:ParB family chromosome partitioning protein [Pseudonocardia sediminis]|uniref:ParB family chromosome partitioning protein n=1 Tax=Pseudonocardia sediminis TaxID=1397368 RepID=A0A4Q7U7F5_PSEST|nr:ParB/RepB/Spo0J family partition protein [Pseudonocardia sediminis]RZT75464.1 ParB family chromosome partitioning protein [Pseudonocardia sediminis]
MGKRVNLAELAREEVPDSYSPPPRQPRGAATEDVPAGPDTTALAVSQVAANPLNRRSDRDSSGEDFDQLVDTIRTHGVLQPIVVCSTAAFLERYPKERGGLHGARWVALIGNRRLQAAAAAGLEQVPALVNDDRVASMYEVMLVENSHRRDLGPLHEAVAMQQVLTESGISQRQLASRIGRSHPYVTQRIALLGLIPELRDALDEGLLKVEAAREIGGLSEAEQKVIAAAGAPYRRKRAETGNAVTTRRTITASSPAKTAESIRRLFSTDELAELVRLLSEGEPEG